MLTHEAVSPYPRRMDLRVFVAVGAALGVLFLALAVAWAVRDIGVVGMMLVTAVLTLAGVAGIAFGMRRLAPKLDS